MISTKNFADAEGDSSKDLEKEFPKAVTSFVSFGKLGTSFAFALRKKTIQYFRNNCVPKYDLSTESYPKVGESLFEEREETHNEENKVDEIKAYFVKNEELSAQNWTQDHGDYSLSSKPDQNVTVIVGVVAIISEISPDLGYEVAREVLRDVAGKIFQGNQSAYLREAQGLSRSRLFQKPTNSPVLQQGLDVVEVRSSTVLNAELINNPSIKSRKGFDPEDIKFLTEQSVLFEDMRHELLENYRGKYVLFENGEVLDSSDDEDELLTRSYELYGNKALFIELVTEEKDDFIPKVLTPFFS
jgi:hypothetical protein